MRKGAGLRLDDEIPLVEEAPVGFRSLLAERRGWIGGWHGR